MSYVPSSRTTSSLLLHGILHGVEKKGYLWGCTKYLCAVNCDDFFFLSLFLLVSPLHPYHIRTSHRWTGGLGLPCEPRALVSHLQRQSRECGLCSIGSRFASGLSLGHSFQPPPARVASRVFRQYSTFAVQSTCGRLLACSCVDAFVKRAACILWGRLSFLFFPKVKTPTFNNNVDTDLITPNSPAKF